MNSKYNTGGSKDVVELLLSKGASVNLRNEDGYTPLLIASYLSSYVTRLQAVVSKRNDLHSQISKEKQQPYKMLIPSQQTTQTFDEKDDKGEPNQQQQQQQQQSLNNKDSNTDTIQKRLLFLAENISSSLWREIATLLLVYNADVNLSDSCGQTPLMLVKCTQSHIQSPHPILSLFTPNNNSHKTDFIIWGYSYTSDLLYL
jgi:ankyrin repeat protein